MPGGGIIRIQSDRSLILRLSSTPVPVVLQGSSQRGMGLGQRIVELNGFQRRRFLFFFGDC